MKRGFIISTLVVLLVLVGIYILSQASMTGHSVYAVEGISQFVDSSFIWLINFLAGILLITIFVTKRIENSIENYEDSGKFEPKADSYDEDIKTLDLEIERLKKELS